MPLHAPHSHIKTRNEKEKFLLEFFDILWARYRSRMEYVHAYEEILQKHGAKFINDHIAFRTLASQNPSTGIFTLSRIFEALGYAAAACYEFPDKHFNSIHFRPPHPQFPKIFITQLKTWELSDSARRIIGKYLSGHRKPISDGILGSLWNASHISLSSRKRLLETLDTFFRELPWDIPLKKDVVALDKETPFGAWVLVNGYDVNHFTASVDSHGARNLNDIEKTVSALLKADVPMKPAIEGERGSKLRQSATEAVVLPTAVRDKGRVVKIPWTYAYFELAERPPIKNPATGGRERFQGFLGGQAVNLFDMTQLKK